MTRWMVFGLAGVLGLLCAVETRADIFITGRGDVLGGVAAGGTNYTIAGNPPGVKIVNGAGGVSYTNQDTSGSGGVRAVGNAVTALGIITLTSVEIGNTSSNPLNSGSQIVAVYALEGVSVAPATLNAASFRLSDGGRGVVNIYVRSNTGIDNANVNTWVPDINNVDTGKVAQLVIDPNPTAVVQGAPFGNDTGSPIVTDVNLLNTASSDPIGAVFNGDADFKLGIADPGTFLANLTTILPPDYFKVNDATLLQLRQQGNTGSQVNTGLSITDMNTLYDNILEDYYGVGNGGVFATGIGAGAGFDATGFATNGDIILRNEGVTVFLGAQADTDTQVTPEPTTVLSWVVLAGGIGMIIRQRRRTRSVA